MRSEYLLAKSLYMLVKATQDPIFKLVLSPVFPEDVPIQFSSFWAKNDKNLPYRPGVWYKILLFTRERERISKPFVF